MSVQLYDVDGYVGELGSATASNKLLDYLNKNGGHWCRGFRKHGSVVLAPEFKREIANLNPTGIKMSKNFRNLKSLIAKSKIAIFVVSE